MKPIYLDYNATTPIATEVKTAMLPFLDTIFGNPSSAHEYGILANRAIIKARKQVAELINCSPNEIVFTSGGTEANNYAIKGIAFEHALKGKHLITSTIEHPSVLEVFNYLEKKHNFRCSYINVNPNGIINLEELENAICPETILITIMQANNETGVIQPITQIGEIAQKHDIFFHTDAAQSLGKIKVDVRKTQVDLLSIAGHKIYAPKGVGALYIKSGIKLQKFMHGANHENNLRAGTENILEIVGLGKAAEIAKRDLVINSMKMQQMRDLLYKELKIIFPTIILNGDFFNRLPNTLNVSFQKIEPYSLIEFFIYVAASAGSACHSGSDEISPVLKAMNVPLELAKNTIRFSTGRNTTALDIANTVKYAKEILLR